MEEHRSGVIPTAITYQAKDGTTHDKQARDKETMAALRKPLGLPIELADAMIRIMDLAEYLGIDLADAIMVKADYNRGRPAMHGGKAY